MVLGKMSIGEAEEVVELLGEGGMLSLEKGVIDGTTEEGRLRLEELEREARGEKGVVGEEEGVEAELEQLGVEEKGEKNEMVGADVD